MEIYRDEDLRVIRIPCNCLSPGHSLDIEVESNKGKFLGCELQLFLDGKAPLRWRLKQVFNLLRGKRGEQDDFGIRYEDIGEIISILEYARSLKNE